MQNATKKTPKKPPLSFSALGIDAGDIIVFTKFYEPDGMPITAKIVDGRRVLFRGKKQYLTPATLKLLTHKKVTRPARYWAYKGTLLKSLYDDFHSKQRKGEL